MNIGGFDINFPFWTRNSNGESFYDLTTFQKWSQYGSNLHCAENHPILTPALLFVSKLYSQADFYVQKKSTKERIDNHEVLSLLKKPNFFQTQPDLLESLCFTMHANGVGVLYKKKAGFSSVVNSLYVLNFDLIEFPESIKKDNFINSIASEKILNTEVIYDKSNLDLKIKLKDLMFFYDLPNATGKNPFKAKSRLDGLKQTLLNTNDSLIAKNIILKTNGKEMLSGNKEGFPLTPEEKLDAEKLFNTEYGLSPTRKRGLITKANVTWKSLHIALRDLGLDESVKVDGNIIFTALHIPKDILSLEAKKTTYNNFKESMVSYIQNEMQATINSACAVLNYLVDDEYEIIGTYEHLPIMQFILLERYEGIIKQGTALSVLRKAGIPDNYALEKCGFPKTLKLNPLTIDNGNTNEGSKGNQQTSKESEEELAIRGLIEA